MDARLVAKYFTLLKERTGFTCEVWAEKSNGSVATLKNLLSGKTEDPRLATIAPYVYAAGGSIDEMYTGKSKDDTKEISMASIKEMCEQRRIDSVDHYEKRLADKREIIEQQDRHIKTLMRENFSSKVFSWICVAILVGLLIAEVMNPNLGWFRF